MKQSGQKLLTAFSASATKPPTLGFDVASKDVEPGRAKAGAQF